MADKITIVNKRTFGEKIRGISKLALLGSALYAGSILFSYFFAEFKQNRNATRIISVIDKEDYSLARKLLQTYDKNDLSASERTIIESTLERKILFKNYYDSIRSCFSKYDLNAAKEVVDQARLSQVFKEEDLNFFERELLERTEEGFLESINQSQNKERMIREYLDFYPEGKHKNYAIKELIVSEFLDFEEDVEKDFQIKFDKLSKLNNTLEEFAGEGINLSEIINLNSISAGLAAKLEELYISSDTSLAVGLLVETVQVSMADIGLNPEYLNDRTINFPKKSFGKIVGNGSSGWIVKIEKSSESSWTKEWDGVSVYWAILGKNVAIFKSTELQPLRNISATEKNNFMQEFERLKQNLAKYQNGR